MNNDIRFSAEQGDADAQAELALLHLKNDEYDAIKILRATYSAFMKEANFTAQHLSLGA